MTLLVVVAVLGGMYLFKNRGRSAGGMYLSRSQCYGGTSERDPNNPHNFQNYEGTADFLVSRTVLNLEPEVAVLGGMYIPRSPS